MDHFHKCVNNKEFFGAVEGLVEVKKEVVEEYMAELIKNDQRQDIEKLYLIDEIKMGSDGNMMEFNKDLIKGDIDNETNV